MNSAFFQKIIQRAMANITKIFETRHEFGKQVGETVAGLSITGGVGYILFGKEKVTLQEIQRVYIDRTGTVNTTGNGDCVAVVYKGSDDKFHKHTAVGWYAWDGSNWV